MKPISDSDKVERAIHEAFASARIEDLQTAPQIKKRQRALQVANAINAIEGVPTSEYANELTKRWANGDLTGEQLKQLMLEYHQKIASSAKDQMKK